MIYALDYLLDLIVNNIKSLFCNTYNNILDSDQITQTIV